MLTQLSQSSKRFGKLKKYKTKLKESGFQFLLQSLDRDKENHVPNAQNNNELVHSVQIDPILTAPAHSFTLNMSTVIQKGKSGDFFLENVKMLDRSDASISDVYEQNASKKSKKDKENNSKGLKLQKKEGRNSIQLKSNSSRNTDKKSILEIIGKIKKYLTMTAEMYSENQDVFGQKQSRKIKKIQAQLINLITNFEQQQLKQKKDGKLRNSINTTCFNISNIDTSKTVCNIDASKITSNIQGTKIGIKGSQQQYIKIINSLQFQRQKLNGLISQHQLANIKMFIKINEGESQQIQMCKKHLAMLFDKYKKLEALISNDKKKIFQLARDKEQITHKNSELSYQNRQLLKTLQQYQQIINRNKQNHVKQGQLIQKKPKNLSLLQPKSNHSRQPSSQSIYQNSLNDRGQLHLQSLNNSGFSQQHGLGSSITTTTSRLMNKKGGRVGINLNALLQNMKQSNINKVMQDPQKLKKMLMECRSSIIKMENVISQQNKELEYSVNALQDNKLKMQNYEELIKNLQAKINNLNKLLQKQKCRQKIRQFDKMSVNESRQIQKSRCGNENRFSKIGKQSSLKQTIKQLKRQVFIEGKDKVLINLQLNKKISDQYRIIAMQAEALQHLLCPSKRK